MLHSRVCVGRRRGLARSERPPHGLQVFSVFCLGVPTLDGSGTVGCGAVHVEETRVGACSVGTFSCGLLFVYAIIIARWVTSEPAAGLKKKRRRKKTTEQKKNARIEREHRMPYVCVQHHAAGTREREDSKAGTLCMCCVLPSNF